MHRINEILDAKVIEHRKQQKKRDYLGVSSIGDDCLRKVQLQYEGKGAEFSASTLRTFDIGHWKKESLQTALCNYSI
jgi:hypothetical protein